MPPENNNTSPKSSDVIEKFLSNSEDFESMKTILLKLNDRIKIEDQKRRCKVQLQVKPDKFPKIVDNLAREFSFSDERKESLMQATFAKGGTVETFSSVNNSVRKPECFFGRIATTKDAEGINIAYSFYSFKFKPLSTTKERRVPKKILCFTIFRVILETSERELNVAEIEDVQKYYKAKVIQEFKSDFA